MVCLCFNLAQGGVIIWCVESTLRELNRVDIDDNIACSTGQLVALLVALFSIMGFLIDDAFQNPKKRTDTFEKMQDLIKEWARENEAAI